MKKFNASFPILPIAYHFLSNPFLERTTSRIRMNSGYSYSNTRPHSHSFSLDLELANCLSDPNASTSSSQSSPHFPSINHRNSLTYDQFTEEEMHSNRADEEQGAVVELSAGGNGNGNVAAGSQRDHSKTTSYSPASSGVREDMKGSEGSEHGGRRMGSDSKKSRYREAEAKTKKISNSTSTFRNQSLLLFLILINSVSTVKAIFDPGEPRVIPTSSTSTSTSTINPSPSPSASFIPLSSIPQSISSLLDLSLNLNYYSTSDQEDLDPTFQDDPHPNSKGLVPFSSSYYPATYGSSRLNHMDLPPGCKRVKDLFKERNSGVCLDPWRVFMNRGGEQEVTPNDQIQEAIKSELVICEVDDVEPLLKAGEEDSGSGSKQKKKRKMRTYAISGTITSPYPLEIETDEGSLGMKMGLEDGRINSDQDRLLESKSPQDQDRLNEDDEDSSWPKEGSDTENGFWRQRNGKMEWQPFGEEPQPLLMDKDTNSHENQPTASEEAVSGSILKQGDKLIMTSTTGSEIKPHSSSNFLPVTTPTPSEVIDHIKESQVKASYSDWTSSRILSSAEASETGSKDEMEDEPSFLSFLEWKEIHLKQEREEMEKLREQRERERREEAKRGKKGNAKAEANESSKGEAGESKEEKIKSKEKEEENGKNKPDSDPQAIVQLEPSLTPKSKFSSEEVPIPTAESKEEKVDLISSPSISIEASTDQLKASDPLLKSPNEAVPGPSEPSGYSSFHVDPDASSSANVQVPGTVPSTPPPAKLDSETISSNSGPDSLPALADPAKQLSSLKHRWNFASFDCAAVVHRANPSAKFASAILSEKKDRYMLSPCPGANSEVDKHHPHGSESGDGVEGQFVIVELCDEISIDTIVLGNYEFFSRMFKRFRVRVARNLQGREDEWYDVGTFRARNVRGLQVSDFESNWNSALSPSINLLTGCFALPQSSIGL